MEATVSHNMYNGNKMKTSIKSLPPHHVICLTERDHNSGRKSESLILESNSILTAIIQRTLGDCCIWKGVLDHEMEISPQLLSTFIL